MRRRESSFPMIWPLKFLDEIVAVSSRGRELSPYLHQDSYFVGGTYYLKKEHENITVEKFGSDSGLALLKVLWRHRTC